MILKNTPYFWIRRSMVESSAGEWIQSISSILTTKVPWRTTAPTRSSAKGDEFSQYRDIILRMEIRSVLDRPDSLVLSARRIKEESFRAAWKNSRIFSTDAYSFREKSVRSNSCWLMQLLINLFGK